MIYLFETLITDQQRMPVDASDHADDPLFNVGLNFTWFAIGLD
jgi:hypothetical protein